MVIYVNGKPYKIDDPNICPHCHVVNIPKYQESFSTEDTDDTDASISLWQCSNEYCRKIFVALYRLRGHEYELARFLNGLPKGPDWPKPIADLKSGSSDDPAQPEPSKFIKTYLQSLEAEHNGLDEIAGMGYRKAIEYLVKDWAIQSNPAARAAIEASWLGKVITDHYEGDLKDILERATWLGNDQSHYNKLFEEYDLDILKDLIDLIMVELDRQYKKAMYIAAIQKRK